MINDIRKSIMLIESLILDESFKDAQQKFSATTNPDEVKLYIDKFKELAKRNIIKGQDKDIGKWIKGDWASFKKFVDSNKEVTTKRQTKATQKKDSIVVYKDEEKQVVVPLAKEASIHYGKNTKWCTAATESKNHFIDYFYAKKITLFYVLFKDGNKYACAFHPDKPDTIECFDQQDKSMSFEKFEEATGVSKNDIQSWYRSNKTKIEDSSDLNKSSEEVQLAVVSQSGLAIEYIDKPSEEVQLAAVNQDPYVIEYISNPTEKVQLAAVKKSGSAIEYIYKKGIAPSEEVQLAAIRQDSDAIKYIDNPSEEVQLAAVSKYGFVIRYINSPSEEVQLVAVNQFGSAIEFIDNPSEEVQLVAVGTDYSAIEFIMGKGIKPSANVQLAAVKNNAYALGALIDNGITPTEEMQLIAVSKDRDVLEFLIYSDIQPTEKVKALHNKLWEK